MRKRELVVLPYLSSGCLVTDSVLWLCLTVSSVCLQCLILFFPDPTHILFSTISLFGLYVFQESV